MLVLSERWLSRWPVRSITGVDIDFLRNARANLTLQDPPLSEERLFYAIRAVLHLVWGGLRISEDDWNELMSYSPEEVGATFRKADGLRKARAMKPPGDE